MKKSISIFFCCILCTYLNSQNIAINLSGAPSPNPTTILDLSDASNNQLGFLLTNVSLNANNSISPFTTRPATGLIVWNTNATMAGGFGTGFYYWAGQWLYINNSGVSSSGTVTLVGLNDASTTPIYTITNSPVTTSGTLTFTLNSQTQNLVFASPNGSAGQPGFRALAAADLPIGLYVDLTTNQTAAGAKTWSNLGTFNAGITSTGAAVNLNAGSSFATNINTGTSTGAVAIGGGSGNPAISINNGGTGATTIDNTGTGKVVIGNNTGFTGINEATPVNTLDNNGSFGTGIVSTATTYTLDATSTTLLATPNATTYTVTLPAVASSSRRLYNIVINGLPTVGITVIKANAAEQIVYNGVSANTFHSSAAMPLFKQMEQSGMW